MAAPLRGVGRHCRQTFVPISFFLLLGFVSNVSAAAQYRVGDLDAWGVPPPSKPDVYSVWSQSKNFLVGDSLLFLYPPSQDAVMQVTAPAFESCDIGNPILRMEDGNSLWNITSPGQFFFISGVPGRCDKKQRLRVSVGGDNGIYSPAGSLPAVFAPAQPPSYAPSPPAGFAATAVALLLVILILFLQT